jgi:tol-pal system protein YbgF
MISFRPYLWEMKTIASGVLGLLLMAGTPFLLAAQSPVTVESRTQEVPFQPPIEEEEEGDINAGEAFYQMQLLQQDVQELRGIVEELSYRLKRMQETQDDRYLELDSRFQNLQQQISSGARPVSPVEITGTEDIADVTAEVEIESSSQNEKALYETALELIRNRQYDLAITQLQAVITQYPAGDFTANAYYWLGEVYAAKPEPDYEQARQALSQVIAFFPENRKVPDAAFKLGKVYHLMGDCVRAEDQLREVIEQHGGKSVAKLAESYLRDKVRCEN